MLVLVHGWCMLMLLAAAAAGVGLQVQGQVDQSGSMLSDDVAEKGYALLCMAMPQTDCKLMTVSEVGVCAGRSVDCLGLVSTGCQRLSTLEEGLHAADMDPLGPAPGRCWS